MITWFSQFANNFADVMFWPIVCATVVGLIVIVEGFDARDRHAYSSVENSDARWRIWTATQGILLLWGVYLVLSAVPAPNYIYRDRVTTKVVERKSLSTYNDAYNKCRDDLSKSETTIQKRDLLCHNRALILIRPDLKVIHRTTRITTTIPDPYKEVYDDCIYRWEIKSDDYQKLGDGRKVGYNGMALIRNNACHAQALEASDKARREVVAK